MQLLSNINEAQILEKYCPSLAVPKFVHLVEDGSSLEEDFGVLHLPPQPLPTFGCRVCSNMSLIKAPTEFFEFRFNLL